MISVQLSHSLLSNSLRPHGLQHTCLPYPFIVLLGLKSISVGLSYDDHLTWDLWTSSEFRYSMQESLEPNVIKQKLFREWMNNIFPIGIVKFARFIFGFRLSTELFYTISYANLSLDGIEICTHWLFLWAE